MKPYKDQPFNQLIILLVVLWIICIVLPFLIKNTKSKMSQERRLRRYSLILSITIGLSAIPAYIATQAQIKGVNGPWLNHSINEMTYILERLPIPSTLPKDINNKIIVLYRTDCPACLATHQDVDKTLKPYGKVYYINSRSPEGKHLVQQYKVQYVPSVLYITKDQTFMKGLSSVDSDGKTTLNQQTIQELNAIVK